MTRRNLTFVLAMAATAVGARAATAQPKADHYYDLENKNSGKFVCTGQTDNAVQVKLWGPIPEGQEDRYAFKLVESGEKGYFYLIHKLSGKYICTETENGDPVHLWGPIPEGDVDHYLFKLKGASGGYYYLLHKFSGKYVCSVASRENGAAIVLEGPIPEGDDARFLFHFSKAAVDLGGGQDK